MLVVVLLSEKSVVMLALIQSFVPVCFQYLSKVMSYLLNYLLCKYIYICMLLIVYNQLRTVSCCVRSVVTLLINRRARSVIFLSLSQLSIEYKCTTSYFM